MYFYVFSCLVACDRPIRACLLANLYSTCSYLHTSPSYRRSTIFFLGCDVCIAMTVRHTGHKLQSRCGQVNRQMKCPLSPITPQNSVSRIGFGRPVPRQPLVLHTDTQIYQYCCCCCCHPICCLRRNVSLDTSLKTLQPGSQQ